jgi:TonB-linked SusC/RagA family outer membrane protein
MLFMIAGIHLLRAENGYGQTLENTFVDIQVRHVSLGTVFSMIEEQTGLLFVFPSELVENKEVDEIAGHKSVKEILTKILADQQLTYREKGKNIVIVNAEKPLTDLVSDNVVAKRAFVVITGNVKDGNGDALPGVNVIVKGTSIGTNTDTEGNYSLNAPDESETLVFSFIGFKSFETSIGGRTKIDVIMESDITTLSAVEIIDADYYTTTRKTKTGSIVKITEKEIRNQPVTNPLMSLQGRVPGLEVVPNSGAAGGGLKVLIRGRNSLRNNSADEVASGPLFIIDGVPVDSSPLRSGSNSSATVRLGYDPLSAINPSMIESIEVLKDADATAIYGSRGANGVILITTKQGKQLEKTNFEVNAYTGVGNVVNKMDLLNTTEYITMRNEAFANDGVTPGVSDFDVNGTWDQSRYTDWQKVLLGGTTHSNDIQAGVSGGNGNTSFKLDGGYHKESVIYSGDFGFERLSGNLSVHHTSSDRKFTATTSVNYGIANNRLFESGAFVTQALTLPPNAPALGDGNGDLNWGIVDFGTYKVTSFNNPLAKLKNTNESRTGNLIVNALLSYNLIPGLSVKSNLGFTDLNGSELIKYPIAGNSPTDIYESTTGRSTFGNNKRSSWIVEPQVSFIRKIGEGHGVNAVAGMTFQESSSEYQSIDGYGYISDVLLENLKAAPTAQVNAANVNDYRYMAYFARIGYDWKGRYLVSLTGRRDGSSRFGPGRQFGNFGAVGVGWVFSEENFIKSNIPAFSFGKLRGSYGLTGNDQIGDYRFRDTYSPSSYPYNGFTALSPTALYNPKYSWESTRKFEAALELGFFEDRITLEVGRYDNRSSNQLVNYQLPVITGFDLVLKNFDATVENFGWEGMLGVVPVQTPDFRWNLSINISSNRNKLIAYPGLEGSSYANLYRVGRSLSLQRLYVYEGVNPVTGNPVIRDDNDDGALDVRDERLMSPQDPKFYGGISNTISYKSFELSFLFQFVKQKKKGYDYGLAGMMMNMPKEVMARWRQEGDVSDVAKFSQNFDAWINYYTYTIFSDYNIQDASFLRLKTLSLSYTLPERLVNSLKLQQASLFLQGQNLFTITNYDGLDPETGVGLPPLRIMSLGVNLKI